MLRTASAAIMLFACLFIMPQSVLAQVKATQADDPENILADDLHALWVCGPELGVFPIVKLNDDRLGIWRKDDWLVHFERNNTYSIFSGRDFWQIQAHENGSTGSLSFVVRGETGEEQCVGWHGTPPEDFKGPYGVDFDTDALFHESKGWEDLLVFIWVQVLASRMLQDELEKAERTISILQQKIESGR